MVSGDGRCSTRDLVYVGFKRYLQVDQQWFLRCRSLLQHVISMPMHFPEARRNGSTFHRDDTYISLAISNNIVNWLYSLAVVHLRALQGFASVVECLSYVYPSTVPSTSNNNQTWFQGTLECTLLYERNRWSICHSWGKYLYLNTCVLVHGLHRRQSGM